MRTNRLTERDLTRIVRRVLNEDIDAITKYQNVVKKNPKPRDMMLVKVIKHGDVCKTCVASWSGYAWDKSDSDPNCSPEYEFRDNKLYRMFRGKEVETSPDVYDGLNRANTGWKNALRTFCSSV